ncbi:MAG: extracellular solute-binding protein, partial [Endomicrobia bacterium]|nr:extracellular solute-binding protein [Endomicrobiia bacterium]
MIMKKMFTYIAAIMIAIIFTSCEKLKKETKVTKEIILWETYNEEEHQVFKKIVEIFESKNPDIKIKVQRLPWGGHQSKLLVAMISHTAPDIARIDIGWMPRLVKSGSLYDLTDFGALELAKKLVPAAVESCIYPEAFFVEGSTSTQLHIFGIPDQTTGVALFYNKKLLRKFGITEIPSTWEEFVTIGRKLTRDTDGDGKPNIFGFGMWSGLWWSFPFFNTYGVEFVDITSRFCTLENHKEAFIQALSLMKKLYDEKIEAGAWITGAINPDIGFMNEMYAMIFTGPWNVKRFKDAKLDFGITLIPRGPKGTSTNVGGTNMVVLKHTKYPKECYKFLEFLVSKEVQKLWCEQLGQIPVNLEVLPEIDFSKHPEIKIFAEQMKYAKARPKVLDYDMLEEVMSTEIYSYLTGQKTADDVLNSAKQKIES